MAQGYSHPEKLVSTDWVLEHLNNPDIRVVECSEDTRLYDVGHIPGAVQVEWHRDLNDGVRRDILGVEAFQALAERLGITPETRVVFYGDQSNWWAAFALWTFETLGHKQTALMDGGWMKWMNEGKPTSRNHPLYPTSSYAAPWPDSTRRALRQEVLQHVEHGRSLIDVRSPEEYRGLRTHMPEYPNEGAVRGGHIPGAVNIPWNASVRAEDGTFLGASELGQIYQLQTGFSPEDEVVVYCRIGERSAHTWFVLTYLLGFQAARNYDGSWLEWGNAIGLPIERSDGVAAR